MAFHLLRSPSGSRLDCGCGGAPLPLSLLRWWRAMRCWFCAGAGGRAAARCRVPWALADLAVAGAAVALAALLYAAFTQLLRQQPARPRATGPTSPTSPTSSGSVR